MQMLKVSELSIEKNATTKRILLVKGYSTGPDQTNILHIEVYTVNPLYMVTF